MNAHPFLLESVQSFEMGLVEKSGNYVGACIKFRRFDAPDVLTHWPDSHLQRLRYRLACYLDEKADFSPRSHHPATQPIPLSHQEVGMPSHTSLVVNCTFDQSSNFFYARCRFREKAESLELALHESTALILRQYMEDVLCTYRNLAKSPEGYPH